MEETLYQALFEGTPLAVLVLDPADGAIIDVNDAAVRFYGYSKAKLRSMRISDINTLSPEAIRFEMNRALQENRTHFIFPHRLSDGTVRTVEVHVGTFLDGDRNRLVSTVLDTAERSSEVRAMADDALRSRVTFDKASDALFVVDEAWEIVDCNTAFAEMLGYSLTEVRNLRPWDWEADLRTQEEFVAHYGGVTDGPKCRETVWRRKDGALIDVEFYVNSIEWAGRRGTVAMCRDVTHAKREHAQAQRWSRAFELADVGVILVDATTNTFLEVSKGYARSHGYTTEELVGIPVLDVYPDEEKGAAEELVRRAVQFGHADFESVHLRKDGSRFPVWVETMTIPEARGFPSARVSFTVDISLRKKAEAQLAALNQELEQRIDERTRQLQASNAKSADTARQLEVMVERLQAVNEELRATSESNSRFMSSVSHEFRTPLNSVIGFSRLMLDGLAGQLSADQERQISMINESGHQLLALVDDVLEFSSIEAGETPFTLLSFPLSAFSREILEAVISSAKEKGLTAELDLEAGLDALQMHSDPNRIRRILQNLLSNAIKFTQQGTVTLAVSRMETGSIAFTVRDTGPGIAKADRDAVFEMFKANRMTSNVAGPGTGLGLAIARSLARGLGGTITLDSTVGEGSAFTLVVPVDFEAVA